MQMVSQIENAMVAALQAAATAFRVPTIESYGGQLDDDTLEWVRRLPAIWVVFAGCEKPVAVSTQKDKWRFNGSFTVFCAQRNLAGNKALRQGDALNPGVYALMQLATAALLNQDLGLDGVGFFEPGPIKPIVSTVVNREAVMVYAMTWTTSWVEAKQQPALTPEGVLATLGLQYFLKPGDNVADAADEVTTRV